MPKLVPGYRDEAKEKILEAAWNVLLERGTKETTMDDVAKALNCSKGALYNYFKNKDELVEEAISSGHIKFLEKLFARVAGGNFLSNAGKYFDNEILDSLDNIHITLDIFLEGTRNEKVGHALKVKYNGIVESFTELFNDLASSGRISLRNDAMEAAKSVYALRIGVLMSLVTGMSREEAKKVWMDGLSSIVVAGTKDHEQFQRSR